MCAFWFCLRVVFGYFDFVCLWFCLFLVLFVFGFVCLLFGLLFWFVFGFVGVWQFSVSF